MPEAWFSIPTLATLPNVPVVPGPLNGGTAGLAAAPPEAEATEWVSPARKAAPDAGAWLAIPDMRRLPSRPAPRHTHRTHAPIGRPDRLASRPVVQARRNGAPSATFVEPRALAAIPEAAAESPVITDTPARPRRKILVSMLALVTALAVAWLTMGALATDTSRHVAVTPPTPKPDHSTPKTLPTALGAVIVVDGIRHSVTTRAATVGALLHENNIALGGSDEVSPALDTPVTAGIAITITRVLVRDDVVEEPIAAPAERREDATLTKGVEKVMQQGVDGRANVHYSVTLRDGVETARVRAADIQIVTPATPKVIAVGTKASTAAKQTASKPAATTTAAKSGAPAPAPVTVALPPDTVKVAAQTPPSGTSESGGITHYVLPGAPGPGYCAHKTLPFGTVLTVTNNATGGSISCIVKDRGPYGAGRILDLNPDDFAKLAPLSQGVIQGSIYWQVQ